MDKNKYSLTVIVPFFNEQKTLKNSVLNLIREEVASEIILVDDFSSDSSYQIAKDLSKKYSIIKLLKKPENEGKGSAVIYAKEWVKSTHVIVHDADLEYSPSDIASLFNISKKYPDALILGSRTQGVKNRKKIYKSLEIINKFFAIFFSILNNYKISDIATCYMLVPAEFLKKQINAEKGFGIEVEILSKFLKYDNQIIEFPISYNGRRYADGKKIKIADGLVIFYKIISYSKFISLFRF